MRCPACNSEYAYQPLIGPPECPNTHCKFYTKRQDDEAVAMFLDTLGADTKRELKADCCRQDDLGIEENSLWMLGFNSD